MADLRTDWADDIGMQVNAAYLNDLDGKVNSNTHGQPQISSIASSATPAINTDNCTQFNITALATAITSMSSGLSGTRTDGQRLVVRIKDNGSPQAITWGSSWRGVGVSLPTLTIPGAVLYVEAFYNSADAVFDVYNVRRQLLPVQIKGSASAGAASVALPTHQPGDLIVIFAFNRNSTAAPTPPTASGTVPAWGTVDTGSGTSCGAITAGFIATASNHTSGTWTGASDIAAVVLRGENTLATASPYGGHNVANAGTSGTSITSLAATMSKTDGTSALLYFYGHRSADGILSGAPTGYTRLTAYNGDGTVGPICCNSKNDTTSDGAVVQSFTGTSAGGMSAVVEIVAAT